MWASRLSNTLKASACARRVFAPAVSGFSTITQVPAIIAVAAYQEANKHFREPWDNFSLPGLWPIFGGDMDFDSHLVQFGLTIVYSIVGLLIFGLGYVLFDKLTPFSVRKEIEEDQNTSLAIIIGAVIIGLSIIIAAAIT
jgi:hypothetical protein